MTEHEPGSTPPTPELEGHAVFVLGRLGSALRDLIEATPGLPRRSRGADVQRVLNIPSKLAWQVHRLAFAEDPCTVVSDVPGPTAMGRVLEAATARGAPQETIDAVYAAVCDFSKLVAEHADSRAEFDSIISALSEEPPEQVNLIHKRAAFRAQSHIHGVQTDALLVMDIYRPSDEDPTRLDSVSVNSRIGFRQSRARGGIVIGQKFTDEQGNVHPLPNMEFLGPAEDHAGIGLIPEFCSQPLPAPNEVRKEGGAVIVKIESPGRGAKSALTCTTCRIFRRSCARWRDDDDRHHTVTVGIRTPCKVLVYDMLLPRGLFGDARPELILWSNHNQSDFAKLDPERDRLHMRESVVHLGRGLSVLDTPDVPRYVELTRHVFGRLGWRPEDFDVFRCRIEYPVMPSTVVVQFELPERPGD